MGGTYRWKDRRTAPDSIEVVLEYKEGFLVRYNSSFGTNANSFMKFMGTRGIMDATKWSRPWIVSGEGSGEADKIAPDTKMPEVASTPHMKNSFELHALAAAARRSDRRGLRTCRRLHHGG